MPRIGRDVQRGGTAKRSRAEQSADMAGACTAAGIDFGALTPREQRYFMRSPGQVPQLGSASAWRCQRCCHMRWPGRGLLVLT